MSLKIMCQITSTKGYYILSGQGEGLFKDKRCPVESGDAIYLPPQIHHQMFNDNEEWLEHHVISAYVQGVEAISL